jgi:hypothetical protein
MHFKVLSKELFLESKEEFDADSLLLISSRTDKTLILVY